jgi:hypothetical protein
MTENDTDKLRFGELTVRPGKPLDVSQVSEVTNDGTSAERLEVVSRMARALKQYRQAIRTLLEDRYPDLRPSVPSYLTEICTIYAIQCNDGIIVRYEPSESDMNAFCGQVALPLAEAVPLLSENAIRIGPKTETVEALGPRITLSAIERDTGHSAELLSVCAVIFVARKQSDDSSTKPSLRRPVHASIGNEFDFHLLGTFNDDHQKLKLAKSEQFLAHTRIKLPVGWSMFEIYFSADEIEWSSAHAEMWAELDLLATVAQRNLRNNQLLGLDNRGQTRKEYARLLAEFEVLLNGPEEPVHQFLKRNPHLLSPTHSEYWSKLPFGDRISDFVFRESHDDYQLVEIEAPIRQLFRKDGQQRQELTHAIDQISDWLQYIANNKTEVEIELGLNGISVNPRTLVVIGRSNGLTDANRQKLATIQNSHPKLRIMTYDDVLENARQNLERILGPLNMGSDDTEVYFFNS